VDIGVFFEGVLQALKLLIESVEQLRGGHCLEFGDEAFGHFANKALTFGYAMSADVVPAEFLVAKGG
jgi:hypothetical protein